MKLATTTNPQMAEDSYFVLPAEERPLIPAGKYHFRLLNHYTCNMFGTARLVLELRVIDNGEYHGIKLCRFYNVKPIGKLGRRGKFIPPLSGDFVLEFFTLLPHRDRRRDRISLTPLYNQIVYAEVDTVLTNNQRKKLPKPLRYSKVSRLLALKDDLSLNLSPNPSPNPTPIPTSKCTEGS